MPFGHSTLAEATMGADGLPSNAAYTYLGLDHLGSGNHGFDESKNLISRHIHLPFGQRLSTSGKAPYHEFTGKPWDEDAALYYFPYRYYSPSMNRWTITDSCCMLDSPNAYDYVLGNPIKLYDNDGRMPLLPFCGMAIIRVMPIFAAASMLMFLCYSVFPVINDSLQKAKEGKCSNMSDEQFMEHIGGRSKLFPTLSNDMGIIARTYTYFIEFATKSCRFRLMKSPRIMNKNMLQKEKNHNIIEFNYYFDNRECSDF